MRIRTSCHCEGGGSAPHCDALVTSLVLLWGDSRSLAGPPLETGLAERRDPPNAPEHKPYGAVRLKSALWPENLLS